MVTLKYGICVVDEINTLKQGEYCQIAYKSAAQIGLAKWVSIVPRRLLPFRCDFKLDRP